MLARVSVLAGTQFVFFRRAGDANVPDLCCRRSSIIMDSHLLFLSTVSETLWPWRDILNQVSCCWNMISQKAQCIWRACGVPSGKQWHKWVFVLPFGSYITSRLQFQGWLLKGLVGDPCGTLDPPLNPSDFIYLTEAAVGSITTWYCSRFTSLSLDQELKGASVLLHDSVAASAAAPS